MLFSRKLFVLAALLGFAVTARAEPREIVSSLTLEQLVKTALTESAQLHALRAKWEALQQRPVQARTLPNPMFTYRGMDATDNYRFANTEEKQLEVEQPFPGFGKRGLRGKIATKEAETAQREYEALQREVVMLVKEGYFDLYAVQQSLSITRAEEDVLKQMQQNFETKYATGGVTQRDVLKAQAEISMFRQRLYELEQQEVTLKARLNQLLSRRADSPLGLAVTEPQQEIASNAASLFDLAERNRPEIKRARVQIERGQYERELMKKEFWPDYRIGVEYRSFRASEDMVMLSVGFDLPIWRTKYRAGVREAEKMIESSQAALAAAQQQASFDVQDAHFKLLTARRTMNLYKSELLPQAEARFNASEAGYRTGKVDFLDLLESERFLLNARVMAAMAEGNLGTQLARLERAVGGELPGQTREEEK